MKSKSIEMLDYWYSMGLEKLRCDKILSVYRTTGSWLACVRRVMDALGKLLSTPEARVA